jgi:hypothetical protein
VLTCPNCHRILFIPEDLPVEAAIIKRVPRREKDTSGAAATGRQVSAIDVMRSIEEEPETPADPAAPKPEAGSPPADNPVPNPAGSNPAT